MTRARFSKAMVAAFCRGRIVSIINEQRFDQNNGTAQLHPRRGIGPITENDLFAIIDRAVEYGRMQAFTTIRELAEETK